jgi:hypothetical protein
MKRAATFPPILALAFTACANTTSVGTVGDIDGGASNQGEHRDGPITIHLPDATWLGNVDPDPQNIETMRIEPAAPIITVRPGQSTTLAFRAFATLKGTNTEIDITKRTVFYVPDNYLVGAFPADGSPTFTTRLPATATDPAQRGGTLSVQAQAANSNDPITTVTTTLTVKIVDIVQPAADSPAATPALPADPSTGFQGTEDASLAPTLVYPNDGALLPPNLGSLEIHFLPGKTADELYEISLQSKYTDLRLYTRCFASTTQYLAGSCVQTLDVGTMNVLAETNRGGPPVTLQVRGANGKGNFGQSAETSIQFAGDRVDGAVYYWTTSDPPRIMRFDFGSQSGLASVIQPENLPGDDPKADRSVRCVGCHSLSRDGRRMAAATGASTLSYLVYISDLTLPRTTTSKWLTVDGRNTGAAAENRVLLTSFNPDASEFVAVAPVNDTTAPAKSLIFHDGATGLRKTTSDGTLALDFTPTFPDWSPDGGSIALTRIYGSNNQTITFQEGGISILKQGTAGWTLPAVEVVPHATGKSRYNATFAPDSALLLYSESIRLTSDSDANIDGYADPSANTWAVVPIAGSVPVSLNKANLPSVADTLTLTDSRPLALQQKLAAGQLMNTFARWAPFATKKNGHKLFWFTVASQRRAGLRRYYPNPTAILGDPDTQVLLWMFALDADEVLAGRDGSYPGFFLPFQDMTTSNHMAMWTQEYVSDQPPPGPAPAPPLPTPAPSPPLL